MAPSVTPSPPGRRRARRKRARTVTALRLPPGCTARSLGDPDSRAAVSTWLERSPDNTLYHLPPFIDYLHEQNGVAEVMLVAREGSPLFALPVHSWDAAGLDGGYSGVVFPPGANESALRRSVSALAELFTLNRDIPFRMCQSAQAHAYGDHERLTLLQCLLEGAGIALEQVYVRLRELEELPAAQEIPVGEGSRAGMLAIDGDWLAAQTLGGYDHATRKKIRNAARYGLRVEYGLTHDPALRAELYARFQPVHEESWARTGLLPKPPGMWARMSEAIAAAGGEDLVVLVLDRNERPLAGVICHAYGGRAIYWSGCTSADGLVEQANPLCMHAAMLACRRQGVHTFELGRFRAREPSEKERSVTHYKSHFGGGLVRVTSFCSVASLSARARAARAEAVFAARRRLSLELARARVGAPGC
jgi:hypothetical protein